jgi:hypothetical protein
MAYQYLAVKDPDDPRYDDLLIGAVVSSTDPDFQLLWAALFTRNEWDGGMKEYAVSVDALLRNLSRNFGRRRWWQDTWLVVGDMPWCPSASCVLPAVDTPTR